MSECPCCLPPWATGEEEAVGDTPWTGLAKWYKNVGQITSTVATSLAHGIPFSSTYGHSWDGDDTYYVAQRVFGGITQRLMRNSGQFTTTIRSSVDVYYTDASIIDIAWDGTDTLYVDAIALVSKDPKLFKQSGNFTSTVKTSLVLSSTTEANNGITTDGTDTITQENPSATAWTDMIRYSGVFSSTVKDSLLITTGPDTMQYGSSTTGGLMLTGLESGSARLVFMSGAFSSTVKSTASTVGVAVPTGISSNNTTTG